MGPVRMVDHPVVIAVVVIMGIEPGVSCLAAMIGVP